MRCYFIKGGRIVDVELLDGLSEREACEKARSLFDGQTRFEGYEVWCQTASNRDPGSASNRAPSRRWFRLVPVANGRAPRGAE
jgi:hypothetical protein